MADIVKAIEKEQEYLSYRMRGEEPFHLVDAVKDCGFESLEEYFKTKAKHEFGNIEFTLVNRSMPEGVAEIFKMVATNKAGVLFVDWENTYVVCGEQGLKEYNKEFCKENDITVFPLYTGGGTIVGGNGDFSFGVCCPINTIRESYVVLNGVRDILQNHTDDVVTVDKNDICINGNKICGSATYKNDYVFMTIMHFSFADHAELISKICTTSKTSKPVAYVDFVTRAEFKQEVAEWLRVQSI